MTEKKDNKTTISFPVGSCPMNLFEEFDTNAQNRFGHCRWQYIQHLMFVEKSYEVLQDQIPTLWEAIEELTLKVNAKPEEPVYEVTSDLVEGEVELKGLGSECPKKEE